MAAEPQDGTQPLTPPRTFGDPLAGLVTGADPDPIPAVADDRPITVYRPTTNDDSETESHSAAARILFDDEDGPEFDDRPKSSGDAFQPDEGQPGMLQVGPMSDRRKATGERMRQAWKATQQQARNARSAAAQQRQGQEQGQGQRTQQPASPRRRNTGGLIVALVLLAVFGVVALSVIAGIIQSITEAVD